MRDGPLRNAGKTNREVEMPKVPDKTEAKSKYCECGGTINVELRKVVYQQKSHRLVDGVSAETSLQMST